MSKTSIEWTQGNDGTPGMTWNPVTGCTEVSPGCDHCYARTFAERWRGVPGHVYEQGFDLKLWPERLILPLTWKKPRRIFVNSMSDLFHKDVPDSFIRDVFTAMLIANHHTYQVLTKRPRRMARFFAARTGHLPPHIWMGTSIESDTYAWRADYLRQVPAAVRFISAEPLLGKLPSLNLDGIQWLICGGESGHGARPMHPQWARDLRDRCQESGVKFFFKQWGQFAPANGDARNKINVSYGGMDDPNGRTPIALPDGTITDMNWNGGPGPHLRGGVQLLPLGKARAGRLLDGREWSEFPA